MLLTIIKSRTTWTIVLIFILGGFQAVSDLMPTNLFVLINGLLSAIAVYFKLNPSQKY